MKSQKQYKPTLQKLGEKIYQHRILKNLPTKEIAPLLSITPEAFRKIEKGESDVSFTTLLLITRVLGLDCSSLIKSLEMDEFAHDNNELHGRIRRIV